MGSALVSRVGFGVAPKQAFLKMTSGSSENARKVRDGETPSPTRETRALPGNIRDIRVIRGQGFSVRPN
ncbi:MAG: hypothetical protein AUF68_08810 [Verrucomicrobia bacterium 13_1_20CM_54_28]|nr:MAG: hypothetical protein AUF68_08810 [Verrucomicrobia bacterium 13_1_20CM_54_28]OLD88582.1 MAG: hypothetical protein AUG81_06090 [Verrucomicrobia bacterium 13_1_20CM_4_54_11]OLE10011.1 MAG: hypothetical protein AUG52_10980 [Verrucomicrobia bacterium 13_1_20CM_3_54_17]PYK15281.1 MAG: hypothetical protein DME64_07350 [Verrucomicrobiota bacterium]